MKYIIAIDQGTTSTRSILFDENCNVVAVDQMEISLSFPKNGWVEQNPEEIWQTVYLTIKDIINFTHADGGHTSLFDGIQHGLAGGL